MIDDGYKVILTPAEYQALMEQIRGLFHAPFPDLNVPWSDGRKRVIFVESEDLTPLN